MRYGNFSFMKIIDMRKYIAIAATALTFAVLSSCSDSESYSDLLRDEEHATNWYLSSRKVEVEVPADSVFVTGKDAPFYRLDEDGYIYMQVVNPGNPDDRVKAGDQVFFRFTRWNIKTLYSGAETSPESNADNLLANNTSFFYGNTYLPSSTKWGTGIQKPLEFLGYDCEVNLVLRSYYGFVTDQTACVPYIINVRYFKPEY